MDERQFPIQTERGAHAHPLSVPWELAELAYSVYAAQYGRGQSLERLAERGGFGPSEMDEYLPDWRKRCDLVRDLALRLQAIVDKLPKCWQLVDGKLEMTAPVWPGRSFFAWDAFLGRAVEQRAWSFSYHKFPEEQPVWFVTTHDGTFQLDKCADTPPAVEAVRQSTEEPADA